jgi:hypothetical protein
MYKLKRLLSILEAIYIFYMFRIFKTRKFFHHPLEIFLQRSAFSDWMKHPISDKSYSNKICPFGNTMGIVLALWILYVDNYSSPSNFVLNNIVWILAAIISLITNLNAFIYLIPCLIIEYLKHIYT